MQQPELNPAQVAALAPLIARFRVEAQAQRRRDDEIEAAMVRLLSRPHSKIHELIKGIAS